MVIPWVYFVQENQQLFVQSLTDRRVINGPGRYISRPFEKVSVRDGVRLSPDDYARIVDELTGEERIISGPAFYFLDAYESVEAIYDALSLKEGEYAYILDTQTGITRSLRGPVLHFPQAEERILETNEAIPLNENQYMRVLDKTNGQIRVVRGETSLYLEPTESVLEAVQTGVNIDEETGVLIRDITSGQMQLITEKQVFIPRANQEIMKIQQRIKLEDHETIIIKDPDGRYIFRKGSDEARAFFLEPYHELVSLYWSSGLHKEKRELRITHIDIRPKYMWYEFEVRTQDNVELIIGITFFWRIVDVETMIQMTDDTTGDICAHARSTIIQAVSQVTLEDFLANFNRIVFESVLGERETPFYDERGVAINAIEVRSIQCKDPDTQRILNEIIQETTARINRLQKQESENEVRLKKLQGEIDEENARGDLLDIRRQHTQIEAETEGEAEAYRVRNFLQLLNDDLTIDQKLAIYQTLRKRDMLHDISRGDASLYFTPADVNLSIESNN
jgi:regulator of protease activity HflC (stomatin/prohibitin superfamily)